MNSDDRYDSLLTFYGQKHLVDPRLLKAQIRQESAFNPDAVSPTGPVGLAQFTRLSWREWQDGTPGIQEPPLNSLGDECDRRNPEKMIRAQAAMMAWLFRVLRVVPSSEELKFALAAYNAGIGSVWKAQNLVRDEHLGSADLWSDVAGNIERIVGERKAREVRDYVVRIVRFYEEYQRA